MLEISNIKVYDLKESVIACRNAMRIIPPAYTEEEFRESLDRAIKLVQSSKKSNVKCHDNFLTGIRVSFDIKYPQYWTPEFQRYHFADIVTSSSKMHKLAKMKLSECCNEYTDKRIIKLAQEKIDEYNKLTVTLHKDEEKIHKAFMAMVANCPLGLELFERVSTNYKQLQTIYFQRKNHKLEDWRIFCNFVEQLPYAKQLILGQEESK